MSAAIGRKFKLGDTFADSKAGLAMRRILSNTSSRSEILKLLDGMQKTAEKYGIKGEHDIIAEANFADVLEKMFGTEAPTSLAGQVQRGVEQAVGAGTEFARGNIIRGTVKTGQYLYEATRGINQENKIKALKALLGESEKPKTVFGKKK